MNLPLDKRLCLIGQLRNDETICKGAQYFNYPVITSDTGLEILNDHSCCTIFVVDTFESDFFEKFQQHKRTHRVFGSIAFLQYYERKLSLPTTITRPIFNLSMQGAVVCFTGFRNKDDLTLLITLIHQMGGSIRKDMSSKVTHLISNVCFGVKYQYAVTFRLPVMNSEWVFWSWNQRYDLNFQATSNDAIMMHKLKPFYGALISFVGFSCEEEDHMCDVLRMNGGESIPVDNPSCTHIVIDDSSVVEKQTNTNTTKAFVVKAEWFWASVQNEACADEKDYLFDDYVDSIYSPDSCKISITPTSLGKRKRRRLNLSHLVRLDSPIHQTKRRSSISEAGLLSTSNSFLENTQNSDLVFFEPNSDISINKVLSRRQLTFLELVQTESNYVNILHTLMTMFKKHLEEMPENEALLNHTEIKMIFGNLPPIYEVHKQMLEDLREASKNWSEDISIGNIIKQRSDQLLKAYPPFINYLETSKETLTQCDQSKPRFHAFLKVCQTRPECGRQSLQDLLVRPVQRLPSISLLLSDILKHTSKSNADYLILESALNCIKEIMTHINEDKRKTEGQVVLFDIFNEISNCPPSLVSSHRSFLMKCEVNQLSDGPSTRGNHLVLFLFSDHLEICKKKSKAFNTLKSPSVATHQQSKNSTKLYKHVELIPLSAIKKVFDISETDEYLRSFAFVCLSSQDLREKFYSFTINEENICKAVFLKSLCRQIANNVCTTDSDKFLVNLESNQLEMETKETNYGTLSKAFKFATRTKIKVGRAFSFNKTPTTLKRAVSSVMSPLGSSSNLMSPLNQLSDMKNVISSSQIIRRL